MRHPRFASLMLLAGALTLVLAPSPVLAQGTGANVNFLTPTDLHTLTLSHLEAESNFRFGQTEFSEVRIGTSTSTLGWAWRFALFDRLSVVGVGVGRIELDARGVLRVANDDPVLLEGGNQGFGDPRASLRVGLIGTPALPQDAWRAHKQGFQLSAELGLRAPFGDYDERRALNPGYNRWAMDLSAPLVIPLDGARRTTFVEISPVVTFFSDNDDAAITGGRLGQDPLYVAEAYISHHLGGRWWFALGTQYQYGGETSLDGESRDNALDQWFGEVDVGVVINRHLSLGLGYGEIFSAANAAEGEAWRIRLTILL